MRSKILFLMQLPPPVHGASMVNKFVSESSVINQSFDAEYVDISPETRASNLGRFSFYKVFRSIFLIFFVFFRALKFRPDLVYVALSPHGMAFYKDAALVLVLKFLRLKMVFHLHGKGIASEARGRIKKFIYRLVFRRVNVIHLSSSLFEDVEGVFDANCRLFDLANGVPDSARQKPAKQDALNVIYLSNFIPSKGAHVLLDAIEMLTLDQRKQVRVRLVGANRDERYSERLHEKASGLGECVDIIGPLYGTDKDELLSNSDVFVLPTSYKNECFPLSILEAMSHSLAVVSTMEGAIPDIVEDGRCGKIFDAKDAGALARILGEYIDNPTRLEEHKKYARGRFCAKYEISIFESNLNGILKELTGEGR